MVVLLPRPAPPLISKLSERAAISGRPSPSDGVALVARGRKPWPSIGDLDLELAVARAPRTMRGPGSSS